MKTWLQRNWALVCTITTIFAFCAAVALIGSSANMAGESARYSAEGHEKRSATVIRQPFVGIRGDNYIGSTITVRSMGKPIRDPGYEYTRDSDQLVFDLRTGSGLISSQPLDSTLGMSGLQADLPKRSRRPLTIAGARGFYALELVEGYAVVNGIAAVGTQLVAIQLSSRMDPERAIALTRYLAKRISPRQG